MQWECSDAEAVLDLTDACTDSFRTFLLDRVGQSCALLRTDDLVLLLDQVRELARLLSTTDAFQDESLRNLVERYYRLTDALVFDTRLLQPISEHKYRWLYDRDGRSLMPIIEEHKPDIRLQIEPWEVSAKTIRAFSELITELTGDLISLTTLASHHHVVGTSPAWSEVRYALARLEQKPGVHDGKSSEIEQDIHLVIEFAELLRRGASQIGLALICGAALGSASPEKSFHKRILIGLETVGNSYRFAEREERSVKMVLTGLLGELMELEQVPADLSTHVKYLNSLFDGGSEVSFSINEWCEALRLAVRQIEEQAAFSPQVQVDFTEQAWASWFDNIKQFMAKGETSFAPDLKNLLCKAGNRRPANLLAFDFQQMTLREWSKVLNWSLADVRPDNRHHCPSWLVLPTLIWLGSCDTNATEKLLKDPAGPYRNRKLDDWEIKTLHQWIETELKQVPQRQMVLIIICSRGSLTASWMRSNRKAGVLLTATQALNLAESWRASDSSPLSLLALDYLVFEQPQAPKKMSELRKLMLLNVRSKEGKRPKLAHIYAEQPQVFPSEEFVVAPQNLEDLFDQLNRRQKRAP
jgi:hypothetical protein